MSQAHLSRAGLEAIVQGCRDESIRFRAGQAGPEGYCFELFRRALDRGDQEAWHAVYAQYRLLVSKWVGRHRDGDELVEQTFAKFWRSLRDVQLARRFKHVGAVMSYLHKCAVSVRLDRERQEQRRKREVDLNEQAATGRWDMGRAVLDSLAYRERRDLIRRWLQENLQGSQEEMLVYLTYDLGLSPAEIVERYSEHFADTRVVRRVKERVLKRLRRRSGELSRLLE